MHQAELRTALRGRDFRLLYATRLTSQLTDGIFQAALAGYVFFAPEQHTTATEAAIAFAVLLLPYSLAGPFAGVFIDRWRRRQILVRAPLLRALLTLALGGLIMGGHDGPAFYLTALLVLGVNRFFLAALSAALPHVVRSTELVTANAFAVTSGTIAAFGGAGIGYLLRTVLGGGAAGTALILLCAAGCYLAAGGVATTLGRDRLGPTASAAPATARQALRGVSAELVEGARYLRGHRRAASALAAIAYHRFLYGITLIMILLLSANHFASGDDDGFGGFAVILAASGAGFFMAALITPMALRHLRDDVWIGLLLALAAMALALLGPPFTAVSWTAAGFVLGVVSQGVKLCVDAIVQRTVLDGYLGRTFAVYDMLFNTMFVAAAAVAAVVLPADGRSFLVLAALVTAYLAGATGYLFAAARQGTGTSAR